MELSVKVVIGGAGGVGKSTYLHRFIHNNFLPNTALTVGISFITKAVRRNGQSIILTLWDLGGQERFRFLQPSYVRGARAGVVFFDMSNPVTIFQVKEWVDLFRNNAMQTMPIVLGGAKLDCVASDQIESVQKMAADKVAELGLMCFIPTSAKDGTNIEELMFPIVDNFIKP
jgi:small GTP-binding protein